MEETPNTIKAKKLLEEISGYPVVIRTLDELALEYNIPSIKGYFGVHDFNGRQHTIGVNSNKPETNESSFVHECIHGILSVEGFPSVEYQNPTRDVQEERILKMLASYLSSAIQHPEVYRRMTIDFNLNMTEYFQNLMLQKKNRLNKKPSEYNNEVEKVFSTQQDIIDGHEYFYYESNSKVEILKELLQKSRGAYNFLLGIQKSKLDFSTPTVCRNSGNKLLDRVIKYGDKRIGNSLSNRFWNNLKIN